MIELLRRQLAHKDRWNVTTVQHRLEWQRAEVSEQGVREIVSHPGGPQAPGLVSWSDIRRIDQRRSAFRTGQALGMAIGGFAGGFGGSAIQSTATGSNMGPATWAGLGVGAIAGTLLGGRVGDRIQLRDRAVYVSASELAPSTEVASAIGSEDGGRATTKVRPGELIHLKGPFGEFVGRASRIDANGISGLEPVRGRDADLPLPAQPISWSDMSRVERRSHYAAAGALVGVMALGGVGGALGAEASSGGLLGGGGDSGAGFGIGFLAGALPGALLGGIIGSAIPRWQVVIDHSASSDNRRHEP